MVGAHCPAMSGLVTYLQDALAPLGPVQDRRFFGGRGLALDGVLFGFVIDERLWLRVDAQVAAAYDGCEPFSYGRGDGRTVVVASYRAAPEAALDDPHALLECCRLAWGAAQRTRPGKRPATKKRTAARTRVKQA